MVTKAAKKKTKELPEAIKARELAAQPMEISRYRNERNLMLYPFCSTSKAKRLKPISYRSSDGKRWLDVSPSVQYGMAKIWDFDILRFALSKAGEVGHNIGYFPESIQFTVYECLKALTRNPESGKNLKWFKEAVLRLASTTYVGNIFRDDERIKSAFKLISFDYLEAESRGGFDKIKINFDERLIESVRNNKGLLAINSDVIKEESGIKKRLLELVKVSKGKNNDWTVGISRLAEMCAYEGDTKYFRRELKSYKIPWKIKFFKKGNGGENVVFFDPAP